VAAPSRQRLEGLLEEERRLFSSAHPISGQLFERAKGSLLGGVPMPWMTEWAGPYPVFVASAQGSRFTDVDGHAYVDFCLGDTGAMTGHAPQPTVDAIAAQASRGITLMLPTEDGAWVGAELARRFGLPYWQFCLTATDANRFSIRMARQLTGRPKVLVFNYCYHGSVDEALVTLENGRVVPRRGAIGPPVDPSLTTRVIEWNDVPALEAALAEGDVACVLAEPVMTNIGIILPVDGFHAAMRDVTRGTGTLLVIDETHTLCSGPGGYTAAFGLEPDFLTVGKPLAGGVPAAAYGMSAEVAGRLLAGDDLAMSDVGGIGGTLSGNALSLAAMRATLEQVLTDAIYPRMIAMAERWAAGVEGVISSRGLPWHVQRLGCRAEYWSCPEPPRNGGEAAAVVNPTLDRFLHLYALNRGVLMTPFHNMALMSPETTSEDVDTHTRVFAAAVDELLLKDV
jgi:glutamate-1-semialdehyde 2,1-aminomutase